jgi:MFS family permease
MKGRLVNGQNGDSQSKEQSVPMWTKNFFLLSVANLSLFVSLLLLLPTLPLYLIAIGGTQRDVGYVMGTYTLGAMLMRAVAGWLLDRYGRKKIMVVGLMMIFTVTLLYRLAHNVPSVMAIRALHGLTFGLAATAIATIAADSLPAARLGEGIGYFGLTSTLSMTLAPMIGLWLVGRFGYPTLFMTVSATALLTLFCSMPVRSAYVRVRVRGGSAGRTLANLLEKSALFPSLITFFLSFMNGAVMYFIAVYASNLGVGNIGLFFAVSSLTMVVSRPIGGRWADHGGINMVILIGLLSLATGMAAIGLSHTIIGFLVAGAFNGFGFGFCAPALQALAVRRAPSSRWGAATGTYYAAFDMGYGVGAFVWGFVTEAIGYQAMYFTTLIPLSLAGAIYYRFRARLAVPVPMEAPHGED